jgi:hypothetical protein
MHRRGFERGSPRELEMEMLLHRREMLYRYGEDMDLDDLDLLEMMEFGERKPLTEEERKQREEEEEKAADRQALLYWIHQQMLPSSVRASRNHQEVHDELVKYAKLAKFSTIINEPRRFQVNYVTLRDVPTEKDLFIYLCRYTCAALNSRDWDYEKAFVLLCGVEEDVDTKVYPLATGIPYLDPEANEDTDKRFKRDLCRSCKRRYGIKEAEFSSSDDRMAKLTIVRCDQKAARNDPPLPVVGVFSVHPIWVYCNEWSYMFGPVDENRRYHPRTHVFREGRPVPLLDPEEIQKVEEYCFKGHEHHRKTSRGYYY